VNSQGQVIGFNTFGPRRTVLTIPALTINRVLQQLLEKGHINRGYLGIGMQSVALPESLRQQNNLTNEFGIMVVSLEPGKAAEQAGIILGDILVSIDEQTVQEPRDLQPFLAPQNIGTTLNMKLIRGGILQTLSVVVGER
jgi:S1-C subfamily serine protease